MEHSLGSRRVRATFNPSSNQAVDDLKTLAANFIDTCERMKNERGGDGEEKRLWALAQTHAEDAAMWAVKAVTS